MLRKGKKIKELQNVVSHLEGTTSQMKKAGIVGAAASGLLTVGSLVYSIKTRAHVQKMSECINDKLDDQTDVLSTIIDLIDDDEEEGESDPDSDSETPDEESPPEEEENDPESPDEDPPDDEEEGESDPDSDSETPDEESPPEEEYMGGDGVRKHLSIFDFTDDKITISELPDGFTTFVVLLDNLRFDGEFVIATETVKRMLSASFPDDDCYFSFTYPSRMIGKNIVGESCIVFHLILNGTHWKVNVDDKRIVIHELPEKDSANEEEPDIVTTDDFGDDEIL